MFLVLVQGISELMDSILSWKDKVGAMSAGEEPEKDGGLFPKWDMFIPSAISSDVDMLDDER